MAEYSELDLLEVSREEGAAGRGLEGGSDVDESPVSTQVPPLGTAWRLGETEVTRPVAAAIWSQQVETLLRWLRWLRMPST